MQLPFLGPMFDASPSLLGIPAEVVALAVAAALAVVGTILLWRIARVEREPHSFRATNGRDATSQLTLGLVAGIAMVAVLVLLVLLVR